MAMNPAEDDRVEALAQRGYEGPRQPWRACGRSTHRPGAGSLEKTGEPAPLRIGEEALHPGAGRRGCSPRVLVLQRVQHLRSVGFVHALHRLGQILLPLALRSLAQHGYRRLWAGEHAAQEGDGGPVAYPLLGSLVRNSGPHGLSAVVQDILEQGLIGRG